MGLDPKALPESFLRCLPKEQREEAGLPPTFEEATAEGTRREEISKLHVPFMQWLCLHNYLFIRARSDRRSTIKRGACDYHIFRQGRVVCLEFKWPGQRLDVDQQDMRDKIESDGTPYLLAYDVASAINFVKLHLGEKKAAPIS